LKLRLFHTCLRQALGRSRLRLELSIFASPNFWDELICGYLYATEYDVLPRRYRSRFHSHR
jgi:hypothetical protein